jgi:hypothetical protein
MVTLSRPRVNSDAIGFLVMLKNTFCHIPGISPAAEQRLWSAGIDCWDAALKADRLVLPCPRPYRIFTVPVRIAGASRKQQSAALRRLTASESALALVS